MILVGEMRDLETIRTALTAAETGHLVFATLHTQDAAADRGPHHRRVPARAAAARCACSCRSALQGIVTQQLLPDRRRRRAAACAAEVLVPDAGASAT